MLQSSRMIRTGVAGERGKRKNRIAAVVIEMVRETGVEPVMYGLCMQLFLVIVNYIVKSEFL